jgi:hypothetical protein
MMTATGLPANWTLVLPAVCLTCSAIDTARRKPVCVAWSAGLNAEAEKAVEASARSAELNFKYR